MLTRPTLSRFIEPAMPQLVEAPPAGAGWLHEIKHDGYRTQLVIEHAQVRAFTRRGHDWSKEDAPIVAAAAALPCSTAIIDGEVVVQDEKGASDFSALRSAIARQPGRLVLFAFDLLCLDGEDLRSQPLEQRRARLQELIAAVDQSCIAFSDGFEGEGADVFRAAEAAGLEGIVSKRLGSRYRSGVRVGWLKTKAFTCSIFDVIGVERSEAGAPVALLAEAGHYVGSAFVTLPRELREAFWRYVEENAAQASPVREMRRRHATWLKPGLQADVRHLRGEEKLRHATLQNLWGQSALCIHSAAG